MEQRNSQNLIEAWVDADGWFAIVDDEAYDYARIRAWEKDEEET